MTIGKEIAKTLLTPMPKAKKKMQERKSVLGIFLV